MSNNDHSRNSSRTVVDTMSNQGPNFRRIYKMLLKSDNININLLNAAETFKKWFDDEEVK